MCRNLHTKLLCPRISRTSIIWLHFDVSYKDTKYGWTHFVSGVPPILQLFWNSTISQTLINFGNVLLLYYILSNWSAFRGFKIFTKDIYCEYFRVQHRFKQLIYYSCQVVTHFCYWLGAAHIHNHYKTIHHHNTF